MSKLKTEISGLKLKNPLMPASGPLVGDVEKIAYLLDSGVGAMVTKTISIEAAIVPRPCIISGRNHIMNAELWSEYNMATWRDDFLPKITQLRGDTPLIISVGYSETDMKVLIPALDPFADAFEVSTHYVGKDLGPIEATMRTIRSLTNKPFFMKMSPHMPDPTLFAERVMACGGDGVVIMNSLGPAMTISLEERSVVMGNVNGESWMSGPAIKPIALALISKIKRQVPECQIIGVGGIETAQDVLEFLLAGASAVQMLSAAMLKGRTLYKKLIDDLPNALKQFNFESIESVIHTNLKIDPPVFEPTVPTFIREKCIKCGKCQENCPYFAISMSKSDGITFDIEKCFGCHLCKSICPKNAII